MTPEFGTPRAALVTGGAKRIGGALSQALAADGWHVVIHCHRSTADGDALAAELIAKGGAASVVVADLADPDALAGLFDAITAAGAPPPALLVNNASRFAYDRHDDFELAEWAAHLDVNLRAPVLLTRAFAATLAGRRGLVVNLLDAKLAALNPDYFSYTISKIALAGATELAARAYAPNLRVNGIAPAVTLVSGPQSRTDFEAAHVLNPLGRGVDAADIVAALRYLVATPTVTGQILTIDAGQRLMGLPRDVAYMIAK